MNQVDYLHQCHEILNQVFQELGYEIEDSQTRQMAMVVIESMGGNYRYFHTFDHVLMVSSDDSPLIKLAALFHDLVYVQVDKQINFNLAPYLTPFIEEKNHNLYIKSFIDSYEQEFEIVLAIFTLHKGDNLAQVSGANEFLSALVAAVILSPFVPLVVIARLATLIELTIPFRKTKAQELTIPQQSQQRLEVVNQQFNLHLKPKEIITTIKDAVTLANVDVSGFGAEKVEEFINNTWLLLPEANHCLIDLEKSTVREYTNALANTEKFLDFLEPQFVFHHYGNQISHDDWQKLIDRCAYNLAVGKLYLSSIVITLSLVDALCSRFCHYISLSFLFGFSPTISHHFLSIINFLPPLKEEYQAKSSLERKVLSLIQCQPKPDFFSRLQYSVLVDFVTSNIGLETVEKLLPQCHLLLENKLSSEEYLSLFPRDLINTLARSISLLLGEKQKKLS